MKTLTLMIAATFLATPALAADEFGSRFGNNTPYALDNDIDAAIQDTAGFDVDDLNDIAPAAGDEEEADADVTAEAEADATTDTDEEHGHEHGDTEVEADVAVDAEIDVDTATDTDTDADHDHAHDEEDHAAE